MFGKELGIGEFNIQHQETILFPKIYSLIFLRCFGRHQYSNAITLNKDVAKVNPPSPIKSLKLISLTIEYGRAPVITIDKEIRVRVTPHFLSANKADEETIPTIAEGHPKLIAKVILATFKGGP